MQLELFEIIQQEITDGLECNDCGIIKPVEEFQSMPSGEIKRKCKKCKQKHSSILKHLKSTNAYPDEYYRCPICERTLEEVARKGQPKLQGWNLDHCHKTEEFRGWLCSNCNTGLGALKDDINRVGKAHEYLKRHLQKS